MRYFVCIALCVISVIAEKLEWDKLTDTQKANATTIYSIAKEYDLAETMIAIAWQESRLGRININLEDKASCGVHHIHIKTFLWQNGIKNTVTNRNIHCLELINSTELSTRNAIKFFQFAKNKHKGNHSKAIMSYNAGFNLKNNKKAEEYLENVKSYMADTKVIIEVIEEINLLESMKELAYIESVEELLF